MPHIPSAPHPVPPSGQAATRAPEAPPVERKHNPFLPVLSLKTHDVDPRHVVDMLLGK